MSKEMQELQKQWHSMMQTIHTNSNIRQGCYLPFMPSGYREFSSPTSSAMKEVVSFMNSQVGQYLDDHPFVALALLVFIAVSAIPVAFFLIFVISTTIVACMGVVVIEGVIISVGGIALLCVLCGLGVLSLAVSGVLSICYIALSTLINYWHTPNSLVKKQEANGNSLLQSSPSVLDPSNKNTKSE
ncbi:lipid droplet assembly factor 1 isoform X2 [Dermochelys coriacea]|uniref:lipid droplet assembly factor 1 isoform X2 n=1 Tax=Dermochelys coriacea TaxID=27794 RepID=UPI001CA801F7|nr:lipid droplet assembly factor 1 isoform X2 [Dermochelys coriacea]XP_043350628.1 lipid droplet assembly factor 1 isoform X2 [Dermochelys coriacea]XP_043350629.1 lipid droplet assembly factor 1 isoform X2 [Dermochelys coriacea]XP_043350630.1 lipid droplet assembly factor 1 isoform X2 [Dermochelys coriacea]XP_043350631.1 lipid droplet assembly factor 1 isoform X2 [Dermochelys coriacea]XP_043350632.1 lipid droplet assembly factor 1 isoform X2 [Dermochelys coriacea]XP_043350633.1 lipid droplet 